MRNIIIHLFFAAFAVFTARAQRPVKKDTPWDVRLTGSVGQAKIPSTSDLDISSNSGLLYGGGIQVDYRIKERFGMGLGVAYTTMNSQLVLSNYSTTVFGKDNWNNDPEARGYEFYINTNNTDVVDDIQINTVDIPICAYYKIPINKKLLLDIRGGIQISIPTKSTYQLASSDLFTQLYFDEWDLLLFEIPAHGLYDSRTDWHPDGTYETPVLASVFAEVGLDFPFLRIFQTRLSAFASHSITNVNNQKEDALIYWRNDYNSIMSLTTTNHLLTYGLKVAIGINKNPAPPPMRSAEYNCAGCTWVKRENSLQGKRK